MLTENSSLAAAAASGRVACTAAALLSACPVWSSGCTSNVPGPGSQDTAVDPDTGEPNDQPTEDDAPPTCPPDLPLRTCGDEYVGAGDDLDRLEGCVSATAITIEGTEVTDLDPLRCLRSVDFLIIRDNPELVDLRALGGLTSAKSITFDTNPKILRLPETEVSSLMRLEVFGNEALLDVGAWPHLSLIMILHVFDNPNLISLAGLYAVQELHEAQILRNPELQSIEGLSGVHGSITNVYLRDLPRVQTIDVLEGVAIGDLILQDMEALTEIDALDDTFLGGFAARRTGLESLAGLGALDATVAGLLLDENPSLRTLEGIGPITTPTFITIANNPVLESLEPLVTVESTSHLTIVQNASLCQAEAEAFAQSVDVVLEPTVFDNGPCD